MDLTPGQLVDWTPIRVHWRDGGRRVDWCHTAGIEFDDPFFDQTIGGALKHPFRLLFRHETTMAETEQLVADAPGLPIAGFVFHLSRCGSTLITQMLAATRRVLALSEPGPLDTVVRVPVGRPAPSDDDRVSGFATIARALAQPRSPGLEECVVKLDAWTVLDLPLVRLAFPEVPWIFVHRDPAEILLSQRGQRGYHMIPGSLDAGSLGLGGEVDGDEPADVDEYGALVLGRLCEAAADGADPMVRFVGYDELPGAVPDVIAPHFGLHLDDVALDAMAQAATRDAKNPVLEFERAAGTRQVEVDDRLRAITDRWTRPSYERLLALSR